MRIKELISSHLPKVIKIPGYGQVAIVGDQNGESNSFPGGLEFHTHLEAIHITGSGFRTSYDLGSGLVTNVGALAMANDALWAKTSAPNNLFRFMKYHGSGTGTNAAAATDIKLQTEITGNTTPVVAGTQVLVSAANLQKYQTVATISYDTGGPFAVTEWGLFANQGDGHVVTTTFSNATGSPFTTGSTSTTAPVTGTPLTASGSSSMGESAYIFEDTANATPHWGMVTSNTTSVITVPAWYKVSDGTAAGVSPANGDAYKIRPIMFDRKQFSAINVSNGDSIQFTYTLTVSSGT